MIRNIVFDMGNVLLDWDPRSRIRELKIPEGHQAIIFKELFCSPEWVMFDAGKIDQAGVVARTQQRLEDHVRAGFYQAEAEEIPSMKEEIQWIMDHPAELVRPIEEMQFLPGALEAKGYHTFLLTNASVLFRKYEHKIPSFRDLEGIFVSGEHRMLKPDAQIYEALLSKFGLKAEETLFIDDNPANVAGGIICGIEGIVFENDVDKLIKDLKRFGVEIGKEKQ